MCRSSQRKAGSTHVRCSGLLRGCTALGEYGYALVPWIATVWLRLLDRFVLPMLGTACMFKARRSVFHISSSRGVFENLHKTQTGFA